MKLTILYEDPDVIVVWKPAGLESQSSRGLGIDMVSLLKNHFAQTARQNSNLSTRSRNSAVDSYVGVIHRLDKPVSGILVFAKNKKSAAFLSSQVSGDHEMEKKYLAVLCGNVDNLVDKPVENLVDYLLKDNKTNISRIVDKGITGAKRAELAFRAVDSCISEHYGALTLAEITLKTGRHHQIRVQMAGHGLPLWGDQKYNPAFQPDGIYGRERVHVALAAYRLSFRHPATHKNMSFEYLPEGPAFDRFPALKKINR